MSDAPLMITISGLRGLIGKTLTPTVAAQYGQAVGMWFKSQMKKPTIVVGRDSRPSGLMIQNAFVSGLSAVGCKVIILGIATTPGVGLMIGRLHADGGVVITASHNPIQWNGIKVLTSQGIAPSPKKAQQIIDLFHQNQPEYVPVTKIKPVETDSTLTKIHARTILRHIDVDIIRRRRIKVVLDSVHGAGGPETLVLLKELGVELIHLYAKPTGHFPHGAEPTKEHLTELATEVKKHKAAIGFAQDPDADRLAIVDNKGNYIGEEYTLALCAKHLFAENPKAKKIAVTNLSSSRILDDVAAKYGGKVYRSAVGEANVAKRMQKENALLGGEGNGGIIWPKIGYVRNSLVGIALILEMLAKQDKSLSKIASTIPSYAIVKDKVDIKPGMADTIEPALRSVFGDAIFDTQDGVRVDWKDCWVHVRPSNTEPILRLIAEAPDNAACEKLIAKCVQAMGL
ncbi:MAG: phosphoglucosamine mutase [Phycisphaeraceae bacterium]|nr:phosphoglucosamine mutase [Phycisphaeraceae bacterium]